MNSICRFIEAWLMASAIISVRYLVTEKIQSSCEWCDRLVLSKLRHRLLRQRLCCASQEKPPRHDLESWKTKCIPCEPRWTLRLRSIYSRNVASATIDMDLYLPLRNVLRRFGSKYKCRTFQYSIGLSNQRSSFMKHRLGRF